MKLSFNVVAIGTIFVTGVDYQDGKKRYKIFRRPWRATPAPATLGCHYMADVFKAPGGFYFLMKDDEDQPPK